MTISAAIRMDGKRTGPLWSTDGSRKYTDQYRVIVSGDDVTGSQVENASGLPRRNSGHPSDSAAIVTRLFPDQQSATVWYVNVTWSSKHGDTSRQNENPVDDPIKVRWERVDLEESRIKDLDDKFFVNVIKEPLRNPPKIPISRLRLIVEQNNLTFDPAVAFAFGNKINSDVFIGQPIHTVRMDMPTATEQFKNDVSFWKIVYSFEFNENKWFPVQVLNEGTKYLKVFEAGDEFHAMDDDFGVVTGGWGNLTFGGFKAPRDRDPTLINFRVYDTAVFGNLNLF